MAFYQPQPYYPQQQNYVLPPQQPMLNGKIVESEDIVRATEVPFGGYGIFPRADLSTIFVKQWCADGTTKITSYSPTIEHTEEQPSILEEIRKLSKKIDKLSSKKGKEVAEDE